MCKNLWAAIFFLKSTKSKERKEVKWKFHFITTKTLDIQIQNKGKRATEWNAPWTKVMEKRKKETSCSPLKSSGKERKLKPTTLVWTTYNRRDGTSYKIFLLPCWKMNLQGKQSWRNRHILCNYCSKTEKKPWVNHYTYHPLVKDTHTHTHTQFFILWSSTENQEDFLIAQTRSGSCSIPSVLW